MTIADLGMPVDFCAWSAALYNVSTHRAIVGSGKGYASDESITFEANQEFSGGEDESKENGCGSTIFKRVRPECLKWAKGDLVVGRAHPEWDALITSAGLYVPTTGNYTGFATGGSMTPETCTNTYAWVTLYYGLEIDDSRSTIATKNVYRALVMPKCIMRPKHGGLKKGPHDFKYEITAFPDRPPNAVSTTAAATTTTSSANVTVASTNGLIPGQTVTGTGIPAATTIASITSATVFVLSAAATASGTPTLTFGAFTNNYTGPFAEVPSDFWSQVTQTSWGYWLDKATVPSVDTLTLISAA